MQSLSEIDTTSKRASKAAGFSWGIAEEIGKAIRNLELFGFLGIVNLNLRDMLPNENDKTKKRVRIISLTPIGDQLMQEIALFLKNGVSCMLQ